MEIKKLGLIIFAWLPLVAGAFGTTHRTAISPLSDESAEVPEPLVTLFDFNDGFQDWDPQVNGQLEWQTVDFETILPGKGFSKIDTADRASLYTKAPKSEFDRTNSHITSPEIYIGKDGKLNFYIGFTDAYDNYCRLQLMVSTDDFKTNEILWNSKNFNSPSWDWNEYTIELPKKYEDKTVRFRFYYTTGYLYSRDERPGGFMGEFGIDNFKVISYHIEEPGDPEPDDPSVEKPNEPHPDDPDLEKPDPDNPGIPEKPDPEEKEDPESNGIREVQQNQTVTLITIDGKEVYSGSQFPEDNIPHGIYIIRQGTSTSKVIY